MPTINTKRPLDLRGAAVTTLAVALLLCSTAPSNTGSIGQAFGFATPRMNHAAVSSTPLPLASSQTINLTESNPSQTVYAYSGGSQVVTYQTNNDAYGNQLYSEIYGFAANPLHNSDPNFDYYIFDIYVAVSSSNANGWYVDSAGLQSGNGPSFNFTTSVCNSPKETILVQNIWPPTELDAPGNQPQTTSVDLSYGGLSIGLSHTFTPPISQTAPTSQGQCGAGWASASNYNDNPAQASYSFNFAFGLEVQKGQPAVLQFSGEGSFYQRYTCDLILTCTHSDHPRLSFSASFSTPPITTITSSPATGAGFVQVDGVPVTTPAEFVWDEGNLHTITAALSYAPGAAGTRYSFTNWNDGLAQSHNIDAPTSAVTFVANFQTQYELNISVAQPSYGTTNPAPQAWWYPNGTRVSVQASPSNGYTEGEWTLDGANDGNVNPVIVVMNSPHVLVASFSQVPVTASTTSPSVTLTSQTTVATSSASALPNSSISSTLVVAGAAGVVALAAVVAFVFRRHSV